jgi:hypothetical protein
VPNGKAVVVGHGFAYLNNLTGRGEGSSRVELYDPATNHWEMDPGSSRTVPGRSTVMLTDGRLLLAGGVDESYDGTLKPRSEAELYDPERHAWEALPDLPVPNGFGAFARLPDGRVGLVHGSFVDFFDPATKTWAKTVKLPDSGVGSVGASTSDGMMFVLANATGKQREAGLLDLRALTAVDVPAGEHGGDCPIGASPLPDGRILCASRRSSILDTRTRSWHWAGLLPRRFAEDGSDDYVDHVTLDDGDVFFAGSGFHHGALFSTSSGG